jgi:hypothetical protein
MLQGTLSAMGGSNLQSLNARTWLAVKGKSPEVILSDLDLRAGMAVTPPRHFPIEGAQSNAGWYLIVAEGWNDRLIQESVLRKVSAGCEVLACTVEERNLSSAASGWQDGRRLWSMGYEGEDRPGDVLVEGDLPLTVTMIRQDLTAKSQAGDAGDLLLDPLFEIPIEAVRQAVGYRPDEPSPAFDGRFVLLVAINPTIAQRLFGG